MPPEGYHVVRSHLRRNPRPRARGLSGWTIAALVGMVWLWGQLVGFGEAETAEPERPGPSVSVPAER
ncbi:hypothetical protein V1L54_26480 [Streptomyces sp. TRM 70361]|uniref:hypothetical protein n=1 Tax=Streptomyces sp. TRM 70361 TaxID=3116553 RepID=UPI002E7B4B01|nr:hypothetical protein [Streptomyces sp. TRM 70361]MEE1942912.1 hypothetical protein [Streptomyces sp. TRM 70361]